LSGRARDILHKLDFSTVYSWCFEGDAVVAGPIFLATALGLLVAVGMLVTGYLVGPRLRGAVKQMPYESGTDPVHDTRRRFDVRFYLVAIAFLIFDVELLFLYPWAVASGHARGIDRMIETEAVSGRGLVFAGVMFFLLLVTAGLVYEWRKGVLRWR
jgi:NADH-quinone oxidoreductase subunit A